MRNRANFSTIQTDFLTAKGWPTTRMSVSLSQFELSQGSGQSINGWRRGVAHFRAFAVAICFLLMAAALGLTWLKNTIQDELRNQIVATVNQRLEDSPFRFALDEAVWTEGKGIQLEGVSFVDRVDGHTIAFADKVFCASGFKLSGVLSEKPVLDRVTIDGAEIHLATGDAGQWQLVQLISALQPEEPLLDLQGPVQLRNSTITLDGKSVGLGGDLTVTGVALDHSRDEVRPWLHQVKGQLNCDLGNCVGFDFNFDLQKQSWNASIKAGHIQINQRWAERLQEVGGTLPELDSLQGELAINAVAAGRLDSVESTVYELAGKAANVQCLDPSMPHQIHGGTFGFHISNREDGVPTVKVQSGQFKMGYGSAACDLVIKDPFGSPRWRIVGSVKQLALTHRMLPWMKPAVQRAWNEYQPSGIVDAEFDIQSAGGVVTRNIRSRIQEGSFSWHKFPFRISACRGTVDWIGDELSINLNAIEAQQTIRIVGEINNPGKDWTGWIESQCDGAIPINEKMLQAFDVRPQLARRLRRFNATGHVDGWGRIERVPGSPIVNKRFEINLRQATVRHEMFDYPIYNITGGIVVENDRTEFNSITGVNNNGQIECNGNWTRNHGLQLKFLASNVLLNSELRDALPANLQKTWAGMRPNGTVALVDVDWHTIPGQTKPVIGVVVQIPKNTDAVSSVSINPIWFPYEMRDVSGKFRFENQRIDISGFAARHGKTQINTNGTGTYNESNWRIRFSDLFANNIVLDEQLRQALPNAVAAGLDQMRFQGNLGLQGSVELYGAFHPDSVTLQPSVRQASFVDGASRIQSSANLDWDLQFGIAKASANIGVPITNANGVVRLQGRYAGGNVACSGQLDVDSMMVRGIQVTALSAPLSIDNNMIGIGSLAETGNANQKFPSATARVFGGELRCDGHVQVGGDRNYFLQAVLNGGKLEDFAVETSMKQQDFSGLAFAGVQLSGNASGAHSTRGNGYIQLRDARIYEVPVMWALLDVLSIREPDRTAFDQAQMEFRINGENLDFQKIELNGNAISLIGQGTVNLDREVDLDFYSMVGRNRWKIPVLTNLYQAGSRQVWWVEVDGTLDDPKTNHQILPGLNDSLKRLFPEFEEQQQ